MTDEPLIVPEFDPEEPLPVIRPYEICQGVEYDGKRCTNTISRPNEYCRRHDPTPDDFIRTFMSRVDSFVRNCAQCGPASAEEILTLAHAAKAYAVLHDRRKASKTITEESIPILEYKIKTPDARATG